MAGQSASPEQSSRQPAGEQRSRQTGQGQSSVPLAAERSGGSTGEGQRSREPAGEQNSRRTGQGQSSREPAGEQRSRQTEQGQSSPPLAGERSGGSTGEGQSSRQPAGEQSSRQTGQGQNSPPLAREQSGGLRGQGLGLHGAEPITEAQTALDFQSEILAELRGLRGDMAAGTSNKGQRNVPRGDPARRDPDLNELQVRRLFLCYFIRLIGLLLGQDPSQVGRSDRSQERRKRFWVR